MPNHLAGESSPYLLQLQNNPVDWYPWGPEAIGRAKAENKPIFLSVGYSACHWCHVMEHESFENEAIARILNEKFISIKVDREERPDVDQIYMNVTQMMTGHGGWPMSVFLTPELKPFYAGTYFPPKAKQGMPGFDQVLLAVDDAWRNRSDHANDVGDQLVEELQKMERGGGAGAGELTRELIEKAVSQLGRSFDGRWGGFGGAPKFPHPMDLQLLLRHWRRTGRQQSLDMVTTTLDRMAAGGIYDHVGGGFARYSVDARWLVPHFEKMLYDNALLAATYVEAHQATGHADYARVARETIEYVLRDMTDGTGAFYSTEDADSEGEEGKFYVWTPDEIEEVLGAETGALFGRVYDVTDAGNFEGHNILNLPKTIAQCAKIVNREEAELRELLATARQKLFAVREKRVHPGKDDKVIVAWNGLMIDALARAGAAFNEPLYVAAAAKAATFIRENVQRGDGRLLHTWRHGVAKLDAYLDDYACLANALVSLYEATFDGVHLNEAARLADVMLERFEDRTGGGFFYTADDHEQLIARTKDVADSSTPSANGMAAMVLVRLAKLTGEERFRAAGERALAAGVGIMRQAPTAMGQSLVALDFHLGPTYELVLAGNFATAEAMAALAGVRGKFMPNRVLAGAPGPAEVVPLLAPLLQGKDLSDETPTLYVCEGFACQAPAVGVPAINAKLATLK
ncbi:MAG TPA: thioredoxin domain-containing protein [Lacipirellulaceae bacterium]|nr:thioredoxin domain-containing protein [Lacipirellulaceae bacterium]